MTPGGGDAEQREMKAQSGFISTQINEALSANVLNQLSS